jgi:flagellar biosynthesis protein FlhB
MSEKNIDATPHHLKEARKKGQVAVSEDLLRSAACIVVFEACAVLARRYGPLWLQYFSDYLGQASRLEAGVRWDANNMFIWIAASCALTLSIGLGSVAVTLSLRWMQTGGPVIVESPFAFKAEKFDPSQMFGRIFSKKTLTTLIGSLLKTALVTFLCWLSIRDVFAVMAQSTDRSLPAMVGLVGQHVLHFLRNALLALLAVSILDVFIQRKLHLDQMKMSHEDVKQEMKSTEGNTEVKQHVRGMAHEILNAPVPNEPLDPLMGANALVVNPASSQRTFSKRIEALAETGQRRTTRPPSSASTTGLWRTATATARSWSTWRGAVSSSCLPSVMASQSRHGATTTRT